VVADLRQAVRGEFADLGDERFLGCPVGVLVRALVGAAVERLWVLELQSAISSASTSTSSASTQEVNRWSRSELSYELIPVRKQ